ncbi:MAG: cbb3-type cytochrome c oxidase subunit II [Bryobacteraceae bacterium]|jgi:cbb3-type cytochrome c oxidase subunit II
MRRLLRMSYLVAGLGGVGFFAMSILLLGVWPGRALEEQIRQTQPEHPPALTASEQRGRVVYGREGCPYCHTQQIRYLANDVRRFGKATLAWETIFDYPHLWGTRRIGPDLSREAGVRSPDWHFSHLYQPRNLVADSVMPAFPWLFEGAPDQPNQEARDLVDYLETLGRDRALAGPESEAHARASCDCSDDERQYAFGPEPLNASPAMARRTGDFPRLPPGDPVRGRVVYQQNCASCHGAKGEGNGKGADGLHPKPMNFAEREYAADRLSFALWNGVSGTAMPAWRDLPPADLAAVAEVVRAFHTRQTELAIPPEVLDLGAHVYRERCAQCHGTNGAGDGPAAGQFPIAPTNFRIVRPDIAASLRALRDGIDGTPMAPWAGELSEAELSGAAYYVRTFYAGGAQ